MKPRELKSVVDVLHELGLSYKEAGDAMSGFVEELRSVQSLWKINDKSRLIKLGLALIVFPEPTLISDILGATVLSVGIIQNKIRRSALHVEDVYKTFPQLFRELNGIKQDLTQ